MCDRDGGVAYDNGFYDGFAQALDDVEGWIASRGEEHTQSVLEWITRLRVGARTEGDVPADWQTQEIWRLLAVLADLGCKVDAILPGGEHLYWSTYCRHGVDGCATTTIRRGGGEVPRLPAQCKTCAAPCSDRRHHPNVKENPA